MPAPSPGWSVDGPGRRPRATPFVLTACVAIGLVLRLLPWLFDPAITLVDDSTYHLRLIETAVAAGHVPARDPLSEPPAGRALAAQLPLGLHAAAAAFHRALEPIDHVPVRTHVIVFIALAGALIALPVYAATRALGAHAPAAWLASFVAATLPAHLHRTFGHYVRFDAPGTTLIATHLAFALRALAEHPSRRRDAVLAALALVAAAAVWRVALVLPPLEGGYALVLIVWRGAERPLREWLIVAAVVGSVAFAWMSPMREQGFVVSPAWAALVAAAVAAALPTGRHRASLATRVVTVAIAAAIVFAAARLAPPSPYTGTFELLALKLRRWMAGPIDAGPWSRLQLSVIELYGLTPAAVAIGPQQFLALGPWFCAAPFLLGRAWRGHRLPAGATAEALGLLTFTSAALVVLTLAFSRSKVLLAPCVAIVCGLVAAELWRERREAATVTPRGAGSRRSRHANGTVASAGWRLYAARAIFAASVIATAATGVALAASRRSDPDPDLATAAAFLRGTPPGSVIAAPWGLGYDLQSMTGRPTLVDGLLESGENRTRILELYGAWTGSDTRAFAGLCARRGVSYVLVPPLYEVAAVAWVTDPALERRIDDGTPPTRDDLSRTLIRLMRLDPVPGFAKVYENSRFVVYRVTGADSAARGVAAAPGVGSRAMRYLALGDSYTIGEGVADGERWPERLAAALRERGVAVQEPEIIARTGWTTDELASAITDANPQGPYDLVSLLIGVNDQYRGGTPEAYRPRFAALLQRALALAGGVPGRVVVLSIPDWGVSPYGATRDRAAIAAAIDAFNDVNREVTRAAGARWVDVTSASRAAATRGAAAFAGDGLHPGPAQYDEWAHLAEREALGALGR